MLTTKLRGVTARLHVQNEIHITLAIVQYVLGTMACHGREAHGLKRVGERARLRAGEFDELEAIGSERIELGHRCLLPA